MIALPTSIINALDSLQNAIPPQYSFVITILGSALLIAAYSILLWKFHRFVSKKNILSLNLSKYNYTRHPGTNKFFAVIFFMLEYIIILPIIIFIWVAAFGTIILVLSGNKSIDFVLILATAIVSAIRILAYYKEELSRDIAKLMPLTLLSIFITSPNFSSLTRLIDNALQVPKFFTQILYYFIFIAALELLLRLLSLISGSEEDEKEE